MVVRLKFLSSGTTKTDVGWQEKEFTQTYFSGPKDTSSRVLHVPKQMFMTKVFLSCNFRSSYDYNAFGKKSV